MARKRKHKHPRWRVYLMHEAPRVGCGWRTVYVLSTGPKWVFIRDVHFAVRAKIDRKQWDKIAEHGRQL